MKNKTNFNKKIIAFVLAMILAIGTLPISALAQDAVEINSHIFSDSIFRKYVTQKFDTNSDGILSSDELNAVTSIDVSCRGIGSLSGIEYFTQLETLQCSDNFLKYLSLYNMPNLKKVYANNNYLQWINIGSQLEVLHIKYNEGLSWPNFANWPNLVELDCSYSDIQGLNLYNNTKLEALYCEGIGLKTLDVSYLTNLQILDCSDNQLGALDLSKNQNIVILECSNNKYPITKSGDQYFLYSGEIWNFDATRASNWRGATCVNTYTLTDFTLLNFKHQVKYEYDLGNGMTATFTLVYANDGEDDENLGGYTISLEGKIIVNFNMQLSEKLASSTTAYMQFTTVDGTTSKVYVKDTTPIKINGKTYYVFPCELPAKEMVCDVIGQIIDGDIVGEPYTYTVKEYSEYILENQDETSVYKDSVEMLKSMLNYGSCAQIYFNHKTDSLANTSKYITDEEREELSTVTAQTLEEYNHEYPQSNDSFSFAGSNLSLQSKTILRLYFKVASTVDINNLKATCENKELTLTKSGSMYYVEISDISAQNLDKEYVVTLSDGNDSLNVGYSVMAYCHTILNRSTNENLKNAMRALYLYNLEAKAYFADTQELL